MFQSFQKPGSVGNAEKNILPQILEKYKKIKIWSAACSTGEEPYSVVMLLSKFLPLSSIRVLATDIDMDALEKPGKEYTQTTAWERCLRNSCIGISPTGRIRI